ncbi:MAG: 16S rRNA (cytidine(1402)-2'-O)-methyltransferase [Kofleriaceae bacterium]|nr:16S rRNA (cytidine(1402)-2'-O)-methyltransferase [Kofleriaceae bacterium]
MSGASAGDGAAALGTLYVVASPIGNLEDLSPRAARVLRSADVIAAEDTRSVRTLLAQADLGGAANPHRQVISVFEGNEVGRADQVCAHLAAGRAVAIVSEAGTPGVSDPGARVVAAAVAAGARIEVVPGPVAAVAALIASGLPSERFLFVGFPPREAGARRQLFGELRDQVATLIFYEAPDRVAATCRDLADALGADRPASLSREISKLYEEHVRAPVAELAARYAEVAPRGECTLVVAGADPAARITTVDVEAELRALLAGGLGPRDAAARLVVRTGKPRRQLYQLALSLARTDGAAGPDRGAGGGELDPPAPPDPGRSGRR